MGDYATEHYRSEAQYLSTQLELARQALEAANLQIEALKRALGDAVKVPRRMMATMDMPPMIKIKPLAKEVLEIAEVHLRAIEEAALKQKEE